MTGRLEDKSLDVLVHIQPPRPDRPWYAVVTNPQTGERIECHSPLELLQHLERLCLESGGRVIGIR